MSHKIAIFLMDFFFAAISVAPLIRAAEPSEDHALIRSIAQKCLTNRDAIQQFEMDAVCTEGLANSPEQALKGEFDQPVKVRRIQWSVDGRRSSYRVETQSLKNPRAPPVIEHVLFSPEGQLTYTSLGAANLGDSTNRGPSDMLTPVDWGVMGWGGQLHPAKMILNELDRNENPTWVTLLNVADAAGNQLHRVNYPGVGNFPRASAYFSPSHGYSVQRLVFPTPSGAVKREAVVTEFLDCGQDRWLPGRTTVMDFKDELGGPCTSMSWDVERFTSDQAPAKQRLEILLPAGTKVQRELPTPGPLKPNQMFNTEQETVVNFDVIAEWLKKTSTQ